jgi:hypothetical protein
MAVMKYLLLLGVTAGQMACFAQDKHDETNGRIWGTSYHLTVIGDDKERRLEGLDVSQGPDHLLGGFWLVRQAGKSQLEVKGHLNKHGEFTPNVSLDVADQQDGKWKTIESTLSDNVEVTLTAAPHVEQLPIRIQLDALQPYIGKFKFWRVTLQTGESDIFPMVWLTAKGE